MQNGHDPGTVAPSGYPAPREPGLAEILAPTPLQASDQFPQQSRSKRPSRFDWASAPATYLLLAINCAVYILMALGAGSLATPTPIQLLHWGANYGPLVLLDSQWWRLLTAAFIHIGFFHLATNMWCLWNLGLLGEPLLGGPGLVAAYLLTGYAGNLLSLALHPGLTGNPVIGAGASGAVFGLAGVLILLLNSKALPLPVAEKKRLRKSVLWFAVLNFVFAAGINVAPIGLRVDNSAHFGGFLAGLLLALPLVPRIGSPGAVFRRRRNLAVALTLLLLLLLSFGIHAFFVPAIQSA